MFLLAASQPIDCLNWFAGRGEDGRTSEKECGAGNWNPARNPRKAQGRLFPDCTTAAMQIAALSWTAPKCGCVYIR